jgi:SAM-dependent methyltransferase
MPFKDCSFDVLLNHWFFRDLIELQRENLTCDKLDTVVDEMTRVLRPGGIIISFPDMPYIPYKNRRFPFVKLPVDDCSKSVYSVLQRTG